MKGDFRCLINCFFEFDFAAVFALVAENKRATFAFAAGSTANGASNGTTVDGDCEALHHSSIDE
jgi:hypothetical protein